MANIVPELFRVEELEELKLKLGFETPDMFDALTELFVLFELETAD